MKTISRERLKQKMDQGHDFLLLEVLSEASYRNGHLPGAVRFEGAHSVRRLAPDKGAEIVAYCSSPT